MGFGWWWRNRRGLFDDSPRGNGDLSALMRRVDSIELRVSALESQLSMRPGSSMRPGADSGRSVFGAASDEAPAIPPLSASQVSPGLPPWIGRTTLVTLRLTSAEFVQATVKEAVTWGLIATVGGGLAAVFRVAPWYTPAVSGPAVFVIVGGALLVINRALLVGVVRENAKPRPRHHEAVKVVEVTERTGGEPDWMAYLYLSEADREVFTNVVLEEIARRAVQGGDLTIRGRVGGIVSEGPWTRLMAEWNRIGWYVPSRGNRSPRLTRRGVVHLRALAGMSPPPPTSGFS